MVQLERRLIRSPLKALKSKLRSPREKKAHLKMSNAVDGDIKGCDSPCLFGGQQLFKVSLQEWQNNCRFRGFIGSMYQRCQTAAVAERGKTQRTDELRVD